MFFQRATSKEFLLKNSLVHEKLLIQWIEHKQPKCFSDSLEIAANLAFLEEKYFSKSNFQSDKRDLSGSLYQENTHLGNTEHIHEENVQKMFHTRWIHNWDSS